MVEIMSSADPVKLYEYFALGRPEVSTPNKHLATFYDGRLLRMKDTAEEFVDAIAKYLAFDDPNWQRELPPLTFRNDDEVRVAKGQRLLNTTDVVLLDRREPQHWPVLKGFKSGTKW